MLQAGAKAFVPKPFRLQGLADKIQATILGGLAAIMKSFFVGRQPICGADLRCVGYELFFRHDAGAVNADISAPVQSSAQVLSDAVVDTGISSIAEDRLAFVNVNRDFLRSGSEALPPNTNV